MAKGSESSVFKLVVVMGVAALIIGLVVAKNRLTEGGPPAPAADASAPGATPDANATALIADAMAEAATTASPASDAALAPTEADRVALHEAVAAGDLPKVQELAGKGVALAGNLGGAAATGNLALVTWLLDHGVDPHEDESAAVPPVLLADAHEGVVAFLLAHGAKEPPLAAAIRAGATNAVARALAKSKAEATTKSSEGELPLQLAVASNTGAKRLAIAKALLDAGAVLDVETLLASGAGTTKADAEALVEVYLAHKIAPDAAYLMIMNERDPKMIARIATKGVAWTSEHPMLPPTPPLVAAARELDVGRVRALLLAGAPVDRAGEGDETALFATIDASPPDSADAGAIVGALLAKGANPNKRTAGGRRPLHAAAEKGEEAIVRALLARNAHVDDEVGGVTALEAAEANGHAGVAKLLLAKGAKKKP